MLDRMVLLLYISTVIFIILSINLPSGLFELSILCRELLKEFLFRKSVTS